MPLRRRNTLRHRVRRLAGGLEQVGLRLGNRVVGMVRNDHEPVIACLAVAAVGAA